MKSIINYTTQIDVFKTIGEIQCILVENGAKKIMFDYENRQPISIKFIISTPAVKDIQVVLPARPKSVQRILEKMKKERGSRMSVKPDFEQACRVAWRVVKTCLEAQMAMIQTEQMEFTEMFLSQLVDKKGKTFYQIAKSSNFLLNE